MLSPHQHPTPSSLVPFAAAWQEERASSVSLSSGPCRAVPSKPLQPIVPSQRLYRKATWPRAPCCDVFIGMNLVLQSRVGFPPTPILFRRYKHNRNSNGFL